MFKKFVEKIITARNQEDAWNNVFYGEDGIDMAYQNGKLTWKEHEILFHLISRMA